MKSRSHHNSILVLATLGVYLGLVLVGATPQVIAQAAMTKQFNVKDEVEVKDDLDNKPEGCDASLSGPDFRPCEAQYLWFNSRSIGEYVSLIERVYDHFPEKIEGIDARWISAGDQRRSRTVSAKINYPFGYLDIESGKELDNDVLYLGNGLPGDAFTFAITRNALGNQFRFESQRIPHDSQLVRSLYSAVLDHYKQRESLAVDEVILSHTELSVEGDHLVIITRLPRGSLDSLAGLESK